MAADEDIELRDLLLETLEKRGVINRIKAELRASVYLALEEQEGSRLHGSGEPEQGRQEKSSLASLDDDGRLATSLVHDFLSASNLKFTLSVLEPEAVIVDPLSRQELGTRLGLDVDRPGPLLLQLLQRSLLGPTQAPEANQAVADSVAPSETKSTAPPSEAPDMSTASLAAPPALPVVAPPANGRLPPLLSVPPNVDTPVHIEGEPHSLQSTTSRRTEPSGSEESVEEELSHLDDSSLSTTADDRTVDQTISRSSDLDGCDYTEAAAH